MKRSNNYGIITEPTGVREEDSFTCYHCSKVITVAPRQKGEDIGGMCKVCMQLICPECVGKMICDPWEKKMERIEARDRMLRQIGV